MVIEKILIYIGEDEKMFNGNLKVKIAPIMWSPGRQVALRPEGLPVEYVSLESLEKKGLIELLPPLEDEGIPCSCEGDLPALFTLTMFMGISGKASLMGNLNVNVTHMEIENNVITINKEHIPFSPAVGVPPRSFAREPRLFAQQGARTSLRELRTSLLRLRRDVQTLNERLNRLENR
jgi:hypothetical protein